MGSMLMPWIFSGSARTRWHTIRRRPDHPTAVCFQPAGNVEPSTSNQYCSIAAAWVV